MCATYLSEQETQSRYAHQAGQGRAGLWDPHGDPNLFPTACELFTAPSNSRGVTQKEKPKAILPRGKRWQATEQEYP